MSGHHEMVPSVDVFHKITNIGNSQVDTLSRELIGDEEAYQSPVELEALEAKRKSVKRLLGPARLIRSEVIIHSELLSFYERAGIHGITEEHIDELIEYLGGVIPNYDPESPQKRLYDAPTLPTKVEPLGGGLVLSVARSEEMLQERALVKGALLNFYQLKSVHPKAWSDDERVTRAWLARSGGPLSNELLMQLKTKLDDKPDLLPNVAHIGGAVILPNPHRNQPVEA
jgi:hypothetical protein